MNSKKQDLILERVSKVYSNTHGDVFKIIKYYSAINCTIEFEDGTLCHNIKYSTILKREIKNYNKPSLCGIGYIGAQYNFKNKFHKKAKVKWESMMNRCYNKNFHKNYPTYKDVTVCEEWHNFQNFSKWFEKNWKHWMDSTWHLDKDIFHINCKIYSPETCCFIPSEINRIFKNQTRQLPIGVSYDRNNIRATIGKYGKQELVGYFDTIEEASVEFNKAKKNI